MGRIEEGKIALAMSFRPTGNAPLDAREVVATRADLTSADTWLLDNPDKKVGLYKTMIVRCVDDGTMWEYRGETPNDFGNEANWMRVDGAGAMTFNGSDTVFIESETSNSGSTYTFTSPKIGISGDTYVGASADNHEISISANVITTVEAFSALTENGSLVDAKVLKDVIEEDEEVTAAALNDLDNRLLELSGKTSSMTAFNAIGGDGSIVATSDSDSFNLNGTDTVELDFNNHDITFSSPKLNITNGTYVKATNVNNHSFTISTEVVEDSTALGNVTATGKLVDAKAVKDYVTSSVSGGTGSLNADKVGDTGKYISMIEEKAGKIIASASTLVKSDDKILTFDANGIYTTLQIKAQTPTEANVKEQFILEDKNGNALGSTIKIYKDNSFVSGSIGHAGGTIDETTGVITDGTGDDVLRLVYMTGEGKYTMVEINVADFLRESEFHSGVTATNGVVHGVVATKSEAFLKVDGDGFYTSGIQTAIDTAASNACSSAVTTASGISYNYYTASTAYTADIKAYSKISDGTTTKEAGNSASTVTFEGDEYLTPSVNGDKVKYTADVITTEAAFSGVTELGKLVDAKVVRDVIVDNERVFSAAVNDLDSRIKGMDYADAAAASGKYVSRVTEVDGVISVEHTDFSEVSVGTASKVAKAITFNAGKFAGTDSYDGSAAKTINVPTKTSDLTNDSNFVTSASTINNTNINNIANYYNFTQKVNTATSLTSVPNDGAVVIATVNTNQTLSLASVPSGVKEIHIMVHNTATSDITVTLPNSGSYVSTVGTSFVVPASSWGEINILCVNGVAYVRAA